MEMPHKSSASARRSSRLTPALLTIGTLSVIGSFAAGIQTAGDIQTVELSSAEETVLPGDIDLDGALTINDAIATLEIVRGYTEPTTAQLHRDPNADGILTVDDAMSILQDLSAVAATQ